VAVIAVAAAAAAAGTAVAVAAVGIDGMAGVVGVVAVVSVWVHVPVVVPVVPLVEKVPVVLKLKLPLGFKVTGPEKLNVVPPPVEASIFMVPVRTPPTGPVTLAVLVAAKVPTLKAEKVSAGPVATMEKLEVKADG
jgi:hypothetical protein